MAAFLVGAELYRNQGQRGAQLRFVLDIGTAYPSPGLLLKLGKLGIKLFQFIAHHTAKPASS
jgi:hypothetical protein